MWFAEVALDFFPIFFIIILIIFMMWFAEVTAGQNMNCGTKSNPNLNLPFVTREQIVCHQTNWI